MSTLQQQIKEADLTQLSAIADNAEPLQENGTRTAFARHLNDANWYQLPTEEKREFMLKLCKHYNK